MKTESIHMDPNRTARLLGIFVSFLLVAHMGGLICKYYFGYHWVFGLVPMFDLDTERSIPTLYATFLLLLCSLLLLMISMGQRPKDKNAHLWILLSGIFLFLGVDEFLSIHERLVKPVRNLLDTSGPLYYAWVIPYGLFLCVLSIGYRRFILDIPIKPRLFMLVSGFVYVSGAVGFEMLGGWYFTSHNKTKGWTYDLLQTCEESLELMGLVIFVYALMVYINAVQKGIIIRISPSESTIQNAGFSLRRTA